MPDLRLCLFGPPRVELNGRPVDLQRRKALALLVYLAVNGQPHSRDALAALFWPDHSQSQARAYLRRDLAVLNTSLAGGWLTTDRDVIELRRLPDPTSNLEGALWLDVAEFERLVAACQSHEHAAGAVCPECLPLLSEAAALYNDDFLAGFTLRDCPEFDDWQFFQTESLRQELASVLERLVYGLGSRGTPEAAIPHARRWLSLDPLHEPAQRQLMQLYDQSGQPAAALRQYEEYVKLLDEELGLPPEEETATLYEAIKARRVLKPFLKAEEQRSKKTHAQPAGKADQRKEPDEPKPGREPAKEPPITPSQPVIAPVSSDLAQPATPAGAVSEEEIGQIFSEFPAASTLPASLTPFIGREKELAELSRLLADPACHLLTLVGPGGIGKTRLALQAAAQAAHVFPQGTYFVPLAPVDRAEEGIVTTVAEALQFRFYEGGDPRRQLLDYLRGRRMLLIMDNFEHILDGAPLVTELLQTAPQVKILATSRERFNLVGEMVYTLGGLAVPDTDAPGDALKFDAVKLLIQQARRIRPDFEAQAHDLAAMVRICRLTQGMPLALVLAAGWLEVLSFSEIATELAQSLDILETELRDMPERQRSVRAAFDYSWKRLSPEEQQVFMKLSVFRGPFTRQAAQAVAGATLWTLRVLVNNSFVALNQDSLYDIHELLRQFAAEHLARSPAEVNQVRDLHCVYYADFLDRRRNDMMGGRQKEAALEIEAELENIRTAWQWAVEQVKISEIGRAAAPALALFYQVQSRYLEGLTTYEKAAQVLSSQPQTEQTELALVNVLTPQAWFCLRFGRLEEVEALMNRCADIYRRLGGLLQPGYGTDPCIMLGFVALVRGNYNAAFQYGEQARQNGETANLLSNQHFAYHLLAEAAMAQGQYEQAQKYANQAYDIARRLNDRWVIAHISLNVLGDLACTLHDFATAKKHYETSEAIRQEFNDRGGQASILNRLAELALLQKDYAEARRLFQKSLLLYQEVNDKGGLATSFNGLGSTALAEGDYRAAWSQLQQALRLAVEIDYVRLIGSILVTVGELWLKTGRPEAGTALLALVQTYPTVESRRKDKARQLLARSGAAPEAATERPLSEVVEEILAANPPPEPAVERATALAGRRFVEEKLIAVGGMGQVYLGRDTGSGEAVAIKRLKPELVAHHPEAVQRLIREGDILRQLNHPNVVQVLAAVEADGDPMIVMEYVPGGSLKELLEQQLQLPYERTLQIGLELADALARVHHLGILHRDLKPGNVLLAADGTPRLTDFGVAYLAQKDSQLTQEGAILGTTAYLSPEAWRGEPLDVRSDIWSFGAVLYEMLAGQPPFAAENAVAIMTAILTQPLPNLGDFRPDVPVALEELIRQMLIKERDLRPDSMRQVAAGLEVIRRSLNE